jgi:G3E family GTPase
MSVARIPVTILSGFLGSGKTTLLRHGLADSRGPGTAIVINEFGEEGLDDRLVRTVAGEAVLVAGGCACCAKRPDLVEALGGLLDEHQRGRRALRRVIIETSGLADPAPIAFTLATDPMLRHHFVTAQIVVTVDAVNGRSQLATHPESRKQVAVADELVVTKRDLAGSDRARELVRELHELNPAATLRAAVQGRIARDALTPASARDGREPRRPRLHDPACAHSEDVRSLTVVRDRPMDWVGFSVWLSMLLHARGEDILRVKGVLCTEPGAAVSINGVQHVIHRPEHLPTSAAAGDRSSRLVFVTRGVEPAAIERSLAVFQELGATGASPPGPPA